MGGSSLKYRDKWFAPIEIVDGENLVDYIHPNDKGYEILANKIYTELKKEINLEWLWKFK